MATKVYSTPGVYIEEKSAFPNTVVAVATAVPAFIGFTEKAIRGRKSLLNVPTRITSLAEYVSFFGGPPHTTFTVTPDEGTLYKVEMDKETQFNMYRSIRLFYANGGGPCYIVSVGDYSSGISAGALNDPENNGGLHTLLKEPEPTMVVVPDSTLLEAADCYSLQQAMLNHCGLETRSRVAVLDIHGGDAARTMGDDDVITSFRNGIGANFLQFGAAYYPFLETTIVQENEVDYRNISNLDELSNLLIKEVDDALSADLIKDKRAEEIRSEVGKMTQEGVDAIAVHNTLKAVSPTYKDIMSDIRKSMNLLPPSPAMAGVYSLVDNSVGVHKAPANVSVGSVVAPSVNLSSEQQEDLNLPLNGKAVNAIRTFVGKGTLVWGARTLDGNSSDWRYINVRRTIIMLEQSIKIAAEAFVFEPNDANTWTSIKGMLENFLTNQWKAGVLVGTVPQDSFSVDVGLDITMTPQDVLDGIMRISIKVAVSRPAEFIVITFQQQMQKS
ncbi:MAG: phage tail sheath C-terminal domain-containing protein [Bacteroidota bacterium]